MENKERKEKEKEREWRKNYHDKAKGNFGIATIVYILQRVKTHYMTYPPFNANRYGLDLRMMRQVFYHCVMVSAINIPNPHLFVLFVPVSGVVAGIKPLTL
jgi:hypothetical protein